MKTEELLITFSAWLDDVLSAQPTNRSAEVLGYIADQSLIAEKLVRSRLEQGRLQRQLSETTAPLPLIPAR